MKRILLIAGVITLAACQKEEIEKPYNDSTVIITGSYKTTTVLNGSDTLNIEDYYNFNYDGTGDVNEELIIYSNTNDSLFIDYVVGDRDAAYKIESQTNELKISSGKVEITLIKIK